MLVIYVHLFIQLSIKEREGSRVNLEKKASHLHALGISGHQ